MLFFLGVPFPASRSKKAHKPKPKKKAVATSGPRGGSMSHTFQGFATGTHDRPQLFVFIIIILLLYIIIIIITIIIIIYYYYYYYYYYYHYYYCFECDANESTIAA